MPVAVERAAWVAVLGLGAGGALGRDLLGAGAQLLGDVGQRLVGVLPLGDRDHALGAGAGVGLGLGELLVLPGAGRDDDRQQLALAGLVALQRASQLDAVDVGGVQEVLGDEEDDEVGLLELLADRVVPLVADRDLAVVERGDDAAVAKAAEVARQVAEPPLVLLGVGDEDADGVRGGVAHGPPLLVRPGGE